MYNKKTKDINPQYSGPEYWLWHDLMPKYVRDKINNPDIKLTKDQVQRVWAEACNKYRSEIEAKIERMKK